MDTTDVWVEESGTRIPILVDANMLDNLLGDSDRLEGLGRTPWVSLEDRQALRDAVKKAHDIHFKQKFGTPGNAP